MEGIQDVCRDAAARWALATADTATLRRRLLVPALRESRGIADHPLWAHTSEPLRPDLEELNERVEHALELGYSLTGALRRSVAYRFRDYTFARLFQPPAIDAERAEAIGAVRAKAARTEGLLGVTVICSGFRSMAGVYVLIGVVSGAAG